MGSENQFPTWVMHWLRKKNNFVFKSKMLMKINCGTFTLWDDGILFGNEKECMVKPWRDAFKMYAAKWKGPSEKAMWFQASDILEKTKSRDSERSVVARNLGRGRNDWVEHRRVLGSRVILYDIMVHTCHYIFIKIQVIYNVKSEP